MKQKYDFRKMERKDGEISMVILKKAIANPLSKFLIQHTNVKPNHVTILSFACIIIGAIFLLLGGYVNQIIGAIFALTYMVLDCVDGSIAKVKNLCSKFGQWLDGIVGFVSHPLLIFCLALGIGTRLSLILGSLAMIAYPMQYLIVRFYKLDITKVDEPIKIGESNKYNFVGRIYGSTLFFVILLVCVLINQAIWVLWFFATVGNLFWISTSSYLTIVECKKEVPAKAA